MSDIRQVHVSRSLAIKENQKIYKCYKKSKYWDISEIYLCELELPLIYVNMQESNRVIFANAHHSNDVSPRHFEIDMRIQGFNF